MRRIKRYLFLLLLFIQPHIQAQLNKFMVQWYIFDWDQSRKPWNDDSTYFSEMKSYNFNSVFFGSCPSDTLLQKADADSLNSVITTSNQYLSGGGSILPDPFDKGKAISDLKKYSDTIHSSTKPYGVIGYQICDEPTSKYFFNNYNIQNVIENVPNFTNTIKEYNPSLLRYVNLLPVEPWQGEMVLRELYYQKYIDTAKPNLLSFDHYPKYDPVTTFYLSLYDIAMKSVENSIPFIYVLTPYENHSDFDERNTTNFYYISAKSKSEFNYGIYAALAYGAKGISYWPGFKSVLKGGNNNAHYTVTLNYESGTLDYLKRLHKKLIDHSVVLLSLNFASAYHVDSSSTTLPGGTESLHSFANWSFFQYDKYAKQIFGNSVTVPVTFHDGPSLLISNNLAITFLTNSSGQIYFWLFNKNIFYPMSFSINVGYPLNDVLNDITVGSGNLVTLQPGEARLFTPNSPSSPITTTITNTTYAWTNETNGFYPYESATQFNIGEQGSAYSVIFPLGSTKSFGAKNIDIKNTLIAAGSNVRIKAYTDCNTTLRSAHIEESNLPLEKPKETLDASVYPNPTKNDFTLQVNLKDEEVITVTIYDSMGRMVKTMDTSTPETVISLQGNPSGIYLVRFNRGKKSYNFKVIKQ